MDTELSRTAYHEAGHAVAIVAAFRDAQWLPLKRPEVRVRSVEIAEDTPGQFLGHCTGTNIYSTKWKWASERFRDLMEAQIVIHFAGGIAEAIHRGERRRLEVLNFAKANCNADADLTKAADVMADLRRLGAYDEQRLVDRTLAVLADWGAIEALAARLIKDRRIEGDEIEAIIAAA